MVDHLFGTLSIWELVMLLANVVGLVLAVAAAGEAQMDYESIRILGRRGLIAGADVRQRLLKATGSRRDETLKVAIHVALLAIGIVIAASPAPRQEYEGFTAFWTVIGVIIVAVTLAVGSIFTLRDRRRLWQMFEDEDEAEADHGVERVDVGHIVAHVNAPRATDAAETDTWATSGGQP